MIAKAKGSTTSGHLGQAGDAAERQMAFYLDRALGPSPNVQLFHDLRLQRGGDVAQIHHLILHRYGMVILESKSVTTKVRINKHGEWIRCWGGKEKGMPSPIQQAKRQGELLLDLLEAHAGQLLDKVGGILQTRFGGCPLMVLVAISDDGIIERDGLNPPELFKADQICDRIISEIKRHKRARLRLGIGDPEYGFYRINPRETARIVEFLLQRHTPLKPEPTDAAVSGPDANVPTLGTAKRAARARTPAADGRAMRSTRPAASVPAPKQIACKHCRSTNISATHGPYGYYFKCRDCGKNTPIDYTCTDCGKKARIRKQKFEFERVCGACGHEERIWVNEADA